MPKITRFQKKKQNSDMKEYTRKLRRHRLGIAGRILVCVLVIVAAAVFANRYFAVRTYETYEIISSVEHTDGLNTHYAQYGEQLLRYSKDGVSCLNLSHEPVWSQTFNMQDPIVDVCQGAATVADRGGNQLYIFNENGLSGQVDTIMPIQQVTTSRQGVTAVLLEDSGVSWIHIYSAVGKKLIDARCNLAETGQPVSLSLAPDGSKLAVSFVQILGGTSNSCIVFYNLGSVGANFMDKIVASKLHEDLLVPRVEYLDENTCVAVGENGFYLYEGAEIPEEVRAEVLNGEIESVAFGAGRFALVYRQEQEEPYLLRLFDQSGENVLDQPLNLRYTRIQLTDGEIIINNDSDCVIYSKTGILRYEGKFTETLGEFYSLKGRKYIVIYPRKTDLIRLQ